MFNNVGGGVDCLKWRNYFATKIQRSFRHFLKCDRDIEKKVKFVYLDRIKRERRIYIFLHR